MTTTSTQPSQAPGISDAASPHCDACECRIARRLLTAANLLASSADRIAAPAGLTSSRWMLLAELARQDTPPTVTKLGEQMHQSTQNISRMLASMEDDGFIKRFSWPGAGRAVFVRCTPQGDAALLATQDLAQRLEGTFLRGFTEQRIEHMTSELEALIDNLTALDNKTSNNEAHE